MRAKQKGAWTVNRRYSRGYWGARTRLPQRSARRQPVISIASLWPHWLSYWNHALDPPDRRNSCSLTAGLCHLAGRGILPDCLGHRGERRPRARQLVDFRALRKNLTKQFVAAYIQLTGKEKKLGLLGKGFALGIGTSYAQPIIAQLLNEQSFIDLLSKGEGGAGIKVPAEFAPFSANAMKSGWQTWWASEYGLGDYYVYLPPDKPLDERFTEA